MRTMKTQPAILILLLLAEPSKAVEWFRGNTHSHTVLCGHADSTPEAVTKWYHDHGYNFLILSEHNKFIDPNSVKMPVNKRDDFILIPGEEVSGEKVIHTTALNIDKLVPWQFDHEEKSKIIQNHVDGTRKAGGQLILNHPNYHYAVSAKDMLPVDNLHMFELHNGHPSVNNAGDQEHPSTEEIWDDLLSHGKRIYAVSSDDAHHFKKYAPDKSNPGRGWVMVRAEKLGPEAIEQAMLQGDFYASSGVFLQTCKRSAKEYSIKIDEKRTEEYLAGSLALKQIKKGDVEYCIEFIGPKGKVLKTCNGPKGIYKIKKPAPYVRARATCTQKGLNKSVHAWGQPVFSE